MARHDRSLRRLVGGDLKTAVAALPDRADDAVLAALDHLGEPEGQGHRAAGPAGPPARLGGLRPVVRRVVRPPGPPPPGSTWSSCWPSPSAPARSSALTRLASTPRRGLRASRPPPRPGTATKRRRTAAAKGLAAAEGTYRGPPPRRPRRSGRRARAARRLGRVLHRRAQRAAAPPPRGGRALRHPRLRRLLRHARADPPAGLGRVLPVGAGAARPRGRGRRAARSGRPGRSRRRGRSRARRRRRGRGGDLGHDAVAMYALAETTGWVFGPAALARTVAPSPRRGATPPR